MEKGRYDCFMRQSSNFTRRRPSLLRINFAFCAMWQNRCLHHGRKNKQDIDIVVVPCHPQKASIKFVLGAKFTPPERLWWTRWIKEKKAIRVNKDATIYVYISPNSHICDERATMLLLVQFRWPLHLLVGKKYTPSSLYFATRIASGSRR